MRAGLHIHTPELAVTAVPDIAGDGWRRFMSKRVTRWVGAVLGIVVVSVGAIAAAAAAEQAPVDRPQPLLNRGESSLSELDTRVGDRQQLRKYFLEDWRDRLRR
jgi:hypothetical protein